MQSLFSRNNKRSTKYCYHNDISLHNYTDSWSRGIDPDNIPLMVRLTLYLIRYIFKTVGR